MPPAENYQSRLSTFERDRTRVERRFRLVGNFRVLMLLLGIGIAGVAFGPGWISAWWLLAPIAVSIPLAILHDRVEQQRSRAARAVSWYERALARIAGKWIGAGNQGERFRDPRHVYADDLDLFGRGSLFELLSTARTAAGESTLARWLLAPGERAEVIARQQSVAELRERPALREDLALVGEDIRAAVDSDALAHWGSRPPVRFFRGARAIAFALSVLCVATLALWLAELLPLTPFFVVLLFEILYTMAVRDGVREIVAAMAAPGRDLRLMRALVERLEREPFSSPALDKLRRSFETHRVPASRAIRKLSGMMERIDSARLHMFFRITAAPLLWIPQFAMAVEAWRLDYGAHIGEWVAAIGEFEALGSLATFAYERPAAVFPDVAEEPDPVIDAVQMHHPLIAPAVSVPNDVKIGGELRLWIVSGSNMSGKSTLLRAAGLNAVLAWAGAPVTCARLRVSRLSIGASLRAVDSLADNRSRFYAEIERLRDIVNLARAGKPTLFLLDELLSGTNSHDRRIGAEALVRGLVERGAIGMVTTHDLALAAIAETLGPRAINVHFEDHIEGGEIRFDYRLHPGVVTRSNALDLMRAVGLDV
ncbi:MAG TPA: hypothetical protein VMG40_08380 [Bryobacteraceae bacterium]|nr:hypothetical protein [Bryobacteraceae bacterium]